VLTCRGETFAGRIAASLLAACGLSELIAGNLQEYENLALELAHAPHRLAALKAKLARARTSALFDTARYARNLERAYLVMRERRRRGEGPMAFAIPD
jgi:predicted O-linked N-acetylglucosamine transferase (SPINDLY family)